MPVQYTIITKLPACLPVQVEHLTAENQQLRQMLASVQQSGGMLQQQTPLELQLGQACGPVLKVEPDHAEVITWTVAYGDIC